MAKEITRRLGFTNVRYRELAKNTVHLKTLFALSPLWQVQRQLLKATGQARPA